MTPVPHSRTNDTATLPEALDEHVELLFREVADLLADPPEGFGHGVFPLAGKRLLTLPRTTGDSRYPQGENGFNFWAHASGYMYANEGLFSIFPRRAEGQEPAIAFFARQMNQPDAPIHTLNGVPDFGARPALRAMIIERSCVWYLLRDKGIDHALRIHARSAEDMLFTLVVRHGGSEPTDLMLASIFNPMLRHQIHDTDEDRWFKKVTVHRGDNGRAAFVIDVNEDKDRFSSIGNRMVIHREVIADQGAELTGTEETPSRLQFLGASHLHLLQSTALRTGTFGEPLDSSGFRENAVAGDMVRLRLAPAATARIDWSVRVESGIDESQSFNPLHAQPHSVEERDAAIEQFTTEKQAASQGLDVVFESDPHDDTSDSPTISPALLGVFFEHLKAQVEFCSLIKGYVQLSDNSLIGIRDVFQAIEGLLYWRPRAARAKMLEALAYTLPDGRCMRQYSLPGRNGTIGRMDLRLFIDQGTWVISTVATYLRVTGDDTFLQEQVGFHEIIDEATGSVQPSDQQSSVLDHLRRIMAFLLRHRAADTGCIRALYGDWNDALDGLGIHPDPGEDYGNGVSVMASLQVLQNIDEMLELITNHDAESAGEVDQLRESRALLSASLRQHAITRDATGRSHILHGWGHDRAYEVGGFSDPDGAARDSGTSNAFWVLSGLVRETPQLRPVILDAFRRLDSTYGIRTFQPHFPPNTPGVGRIGKLPPGTAENGAVYVHATAFAIMALFELGEARWAWEQLGKILPFTPLHHRLSHSPFVMPNSYSENIELNLDGENMNDWQTGSSNVVLKTIIRHVIGYQPRADVLRIAPAAWCPFTRWTCRLSHRGRPLTINWSREGRGLRAFHLNAQPVTGNPDTALGTNVLELPLHVLPTTGELQIRIED